MNLVELVCDLSEASNEVFRVAAIDHDSEHALQVLTALGAVCEGPRPDSITCRACDGDHSAAIEFDAQARSYTHFCPEAGWVPVSDSDLATLSFNPEWLVNCLFSALAITKPTRSRALIPGRVWRLGDISCGVTVFFARRVSSQKALDELASMLGSTHLAEKTLVITTSPQVPRHVQLAHGLAFVDLREIGLTVDHRLQVDRERLVSLGHAIPGRSNIAKRAIKTARKTRLEPARLDYRQADRLLVAEMHDMILAEKACNPTDAARSLARHAAGHGNEGSKVTRLVTRYREEHPSD